MCDGGERAGDGCERSRPLPLVANYLGSRGAADRCAGSWCNLDYALAEMWGGTLERSGTLVAGASCCDFRFRVPANPEAPFGATPGRALPMVAA